MFAKHKKMKPPLLFITLTLIFVHMRSTAGHQFVKTNTLEKTDLEELQVSLPEAKQLCQRVQDSRIQTNHRYMWTEVKPADQPKNEQKTLAAGCFRAKYVKCKGEPRYPVSKSCGFFTLVPETECSSTGRFRRSTTTKPVTLSHSMAAQLCASIHNLPEESIPVQINYVPIKLNMAGEDKSLHLSDQCIRWTNDACDKNENQQQTADCRYWSLKLHSAEKCAHYNKFFTMFNSTELARLPNPMNQKTDFLQGQNSTSEAPAYVADTFSNVVECKSEDGSVSCEIIPKSQGGRSKRGAKSYPTTVSRVKRGCCGLGWCGPCGHSKFYGPRPSCNCANNGECENIGLCDMVMYPSGCYGNCEIGK